MEISDEQNQKIAAIAKKFGLRLVLLFGSRATGKTHPFSDYDFGYITHRKLNYQEEYILQKELAKIFKIKMNKREDIVETVNLENLNPLFKYQVLKKSKIIYQSPGAYSRFFAAALQEYFESEKLFLLQKKIIKNKIEAIKISL